MRTRALTLISCAFSLATAMLTCAEAAPISSGNMPAYCRGEVAGQYGTRPAYVKTGKTLKAKDGSFSISGTVDKGNEGIKKFKCRFDRTRNFIDVMAMTSDGE